MQCNAMSMYACMLVCLCVSPCCDLCLIHADLWSQRLVITTLAPSRPPAVAAVVAVVVAAVAAVAVAAVAVGKLPQSPQQNTPGSAAATLPLSSEQPYSLSFRIHLSRHP